MSKPLLSELQYRTLTIGARRRALGRHNGRSICPTGWLGPVDVSPADVKMIYYGFPVQRQGKIQFNAKAFGLARYRAAGAAIAKSFTRLCVQGLAERRSGGLLLTEHGLDLANRFISPLEAGWLDERLTP